MRFNIDEVTRLQICSFIRAGGVPWVAAEAAGVPRRVFQRWMARGERNPKPPFGPFYEEVLKAQAQARLKAEVELREQNALQWLKCGPGKEYAGQPGWSEPVSPQALVSLGTVVPENEIWQMLGVLKEVLEKYPAAHAEILAKLSSDELARRLKPKGKPERHPPAEAPPEPRYSLRDEPFAVPITPAG